MAKPRTTVTAEQVEAALEKRCPAGAWALLWQVGNATGFGCSRHADAVAMSLWPSRGIELHGFEIKVSRTDWVKELGDPAKAEAIAKHCDRWWLVVGDAAIVKDGELPATWGLLVLKGDKLVCAKEAPKLEHEAMPMAFIAALFRRAHEVSHRRVQEAEARGYRRGVEATPKVEPADGAEMHWKRSHDELRRAVDTFQESSGVKIDRWNVGNVGRAVETLLSHHRQGVEGAPGRIDIAAEAFERLAKQLRREEKTLAEALKFMPTAQEQAQEQASA